MKIGFIGGGNMASALISGLIASGQAAADIVLTDTDGKKCDVWAKKGVTIADSASHLEEISELIIFAVKPNVIENVLNKMKGYTDKIYLSIAAGVSLSYLEGKLGSDKKIVRTMPNTPAQVSCGMTVIAPNSNLDNEEISNIREIFSGVGATEIMPEKFINVATALHGSSPAYVYMMIDAMADAGVAMGLSKEQALALSAKAVEGSAKMVMETGIHPEQLKDNVCSPGGTTIAAVNDLEKNGFRAVIQSAIRACIKRADEMSK